jgi:hypothetical protein
MYHTSKGGRARIGTARIVGFAFLAVWTLNSAYESYGQGYVPLYHDKDRARGVGRTLAKGPECKPRDDRLAIHDRRRPNQATPVVPELSSVTEH